MSVGPVELLVLKFPGNRFKGDVAPALKELVSAGLIRIFDVLFAMKDEDGTVAVREIAQLHPDDYVAFDPLVEEVAGLLTADDLRHLTGNMENNSSVGVLLFENVWARRFRDAAAAAGGEVVMNERVPHSVIEELLAASAEARV